MQERLVFKVLSQHMIDWSYFFNDYINGVRAPNAFITQVLANLEMEQYTNKSVVVEHNESMTDMILI